MTRANLSTKLRTLALVTAIVAAASAASGCILQTDMGTGSSAFGLADLEVRWTIAGRDSASLCSAYGIDSWVVELRGAESRDVVLDCRNNYWTTENDLLLLQEGFYNVHVIALDTTGYEISRLNTSVNLIDQGYVDLVDLDFSPAQL
ncbi:MAG: hypothetical protein KAI47_20705 [Deltaproteobacteria bacterium]|nr:hypothetical protein [Deltaproteobacteria bacterium]